MDAWTDGWISVSVRKFSGKSDVWMDGRVSLRLR